MKSGWENYFSELLVVIRCETMDLLIPNYADALKKNHDKNDIVARWMIPIRGKLYDVEFEHGTVSGKRVIWVNGEVRLNFCVIFWILFKQNSIQ